MVEPIDPEEELGSFLRQNAGKDWAAEAAEDERQTEALRQRQMDLLALAEDAGHRGERATAEMSGTVISGPILTTGTDYVTIQMPEQEADVRLDVATWSFVEGQGGSAATKSGMSFVGLLKQHASSDSRLRLELTDGSALMGRIKAVGEDHLRVEDPDGRIAYVPLGSVRSVIRSASRR